MCLQSHPAWRNHPAFPSKKSAISGKSRKPRSKKKISSSGGTPRKKGGKDDDDEPYLTSQQRYNEKRKKEQLKRTSIKRRRRRSLDNEMNFFGEISSDDVGEAVRKNPSRHSRESSVASYVDANSDVETNIQKGTEMFDPDFLTPIQRAKKKNYKKKPKVSSSLSMDNNRSQSLPDLPGTVVHVSPRRNPSRRSREGSVIESNDNDATISTNMPNDTSNSTIPPIKKKGKKRKIESTLQTSSDVGSATSMRRNPSRSCKTLLNKCTITIEDDIDLKISTIDILKSPNVIENSGNNSKGMSLDFSGQLQRRGQSDTQEVISEGSTDSIYISSDNNDNDYLSPRKTSKKKSKRNRLKGKYVILKDIAEDNVNSGSEEEIEIPTVLSTLDIGEYKPCEWCAALRFGKNAYCCGKGTVFIPPMQAMPPELEELFFGDSPEAKMFRKSILTCNTLFSMASLQRHGVPAAPHGLPVQKVQGVVDAYPSAAFPHNPQQPAFANFYVYHGQEALNKRMNMFQNIDKSILEILQRVMEENNDMAKNYKALGEFVRQHSADPDMGKYVRMKIINSWDVDQTKLQGHQGIYRTQEQKNKDYIAVFYTASVEQQDIDLPGLIIYPKRGARNIRPIHYWNQLVDPLCYPLLFPYGEFGYKKKHFVLYDKQQKSYWLRLFEYYENDPTALVISESVKSIADIRQFAERDGNNGEEINNDDDNEESKLNAATELSLQITPSDPPDYETSRQHQHEVAMEEMIDEDIRNGEEDLDDIYSENGDDINSQPTVQRDDVDTNADRPTAQSDEQSDNENSVASSASENGRNGESDGGIDTESKKQQFASQRQYIIYQYQTRKHIRNRFTNSGALGQLFLIHSHTRILRGRFDEIRRHVRQNVKTSKSKVMKAVRASAEKKGITVGIATLLSEKIAGSPRWLQEKFENTVSLSNKFGPPDCFLTATCNTAWPEIKDNLEPGQTWAQNPCLVNNVFEEKLDKLLDLIFGKKQNGGKGPRSKKGIFGKILWYSYSIEFQQRGPPHAHIVFSLKKHIKTAAQIEKIVQACLPDDPELRDLVEQFMIHRPCEGDQTAYCRPSEKYRKSKMCKKSFPKEFSATTKFGDRHYPEYYRPDNGEKSRKTPGADNRHVVPYNSALLTAWKGHINIEVVSTLRVVKYIFKYLFKGFDRVLVEIATNVENMDMSQMTIDGHLIYPKGLKIPPGALEKRKNEAIKHLKKLGIPLLDKNGKEVLVYDELLIVQDMRALTTCESAWDLARFPRHGCSHTVLEQGVHEEDEEPLCFDPEKIDEICQKIQEDKIHTKLKAWFKLNTEDADARDFTFDEIPLFYTFKGGKWVKKERYDRNIVVRIATVPPSNQEAFAIRILCQNRKGMESFEDLRTVNGTIHNYFTDAAKALRLMNDQKEWEDCLSEASRKYNPCQMRRLFLQIITNNDVNDPRQLYDKFLDQFLENNDSWSEETKEAQALHHLETYLLVLGKKLSDFKLPKYDRDVLPHNAYLVDDSGRVPRKIGRQFAANLRKGLKEEQSEVFETIFKAVLNGNRNCRTPNAFFLQGSGGTGKTVLMKALFYNLVHVKKKVVCVAHTGFAASLLPMGTTSHRLFHLPLDVNELMSCQVELEQAEADYLREIDCVIWDEATMTDRRCYEAVHRLMLKLHDASSYRPFSGIHFVLSGDWKQTLPIVRETRSVGLANYILLKWRFWKDFHVFELTKNRRAEEDPEYASYIEDVGWGTTNIVTNSSRPEDQLVELPLSCLVQSENEVITKVFGGPGTPEEKLEYFKDSAILAVDNKTTFDINKKVLSLLSTKEESFKSVDTYDEKSGLRALNPETYHQITPSGMPPHDLRLKVGATVILLRNMNVSLGLTNGTRLRIIEIGKEILRLKHLDEKRKDEDVLLPKVLFAPFKANSRELAFTRKQFPIRLSFCITCNRAQGQTLKRAGLILRSPCFSHGQLYVALSRVRSRKHLFIYNASSNPTRTNNVIFPIVFAMLQAKLKNPSLKGILRKRIVYDTDPSGAESEMFILENNQNADSIQKDREDYDLEDYENDPVRQMEFRLLNEIYAAEEEELRKKSPLSSNSNFIPADETFIEKPQSSRYQTDFDSGSDIEYGGMFSGAHPEIAEQNGTINIVTNTRSESCDTSGLLKLRQEGNNCFVNTAVQVINHLWRKEVLEYKGSDDIMNKLQEILAFEGTTTTLTLLDTAPGGGSFEFFNDGEQHDADEYLLYILESLSRVEDIMETIRLTRHQTDVCSHRWCSTSSTAPSVIEKHLSIHDKTPHQTLEEYIAGVEKVEEIQKRCPNAGHSGDSNVNHKRVTKFKVNDKSKFLFVQMILYANDYGRKNRVTFNDRKMIYQEENTVFDCLFEPIVMMEYIGTGGVGHYKAYIRNNLGWLCVDADTHTQLYSAPNMKNIKLFVLKKHVRETTLFERIMNGIGMKTLGKDKKKKRDRPPCDVVEIDQNSHSKNTNPITNSKISKSVRFSSAQKRSLKIYSGDMFHVKTDGIVNAANSKLKFGNKPFVHIISEAVAIFVPSSAVRCLQTGCLYFCTMDYPVALFLLFL